MALATITLLCSQSDVEHYFSARAVKLHLDDNADGIVDAGEQAAMTDALTEAAETIYYYCYQIYSPAALATSNLVNRMATHFAGYRLAGRKGNPIPETVVEDVAKDEERLKEVRDANGRLPGVPLRRILAPIVDNIRVDPRYNFRCIRVERNQSSQHNQTGQRVNPDWQDAFSFEM